jgi:hypothetical protein
MDCSGIYGSAIAVATKCQRNVFPGISTDTGIENHCRDEPENDMGPITFRQ